MPFLKQLAILAVRFQVPSLLPKTFLPAGAKTSTGGVTDEIEAFSRPGTAGAVARRDCAGPGGRRRERHWGRRI